MGGRGKIYQVRCKVQTGPTSCWVGWAKVQSMLDGRGNSSGERLDVDMAVLTLGNSMALDQ